MTIFVCLLQVTHQNESNQDYLLQYQSGVFATTLMDLYTLCHDQVPLANALDAKNKPAPSSDASASTSDMPIIPNLPPLPPGSHPNKKQHIVATDATAPRKKKDASAAGALHGVSSALITTMKVLVNLTHNSRKVGLGSKTLGLLPLTYNITLR